MQGRRTVSRRAAIVLLSLVLATLFQAAPAGATHRARLTQTRRELRAARARLASLVRDDREILAVIGSMSRQLRSTQSSLTSARSHLAAINARITSQEARLVELRRLERSRADAVSRRARELYIIGPGIPMESFLDARDYTEFIDRTATLGYVMSYDKIVIEDLQRVQDTTRKIRAALQVQKRSAVEVRNDIAEREEIQSELLDTRLVARRQLNSRIDAYRSEIRSLEAEQQRIIDLIRSRTGGSVSTGPISRRGFAWPIRGRVTSPYGPRWGGFHTGVDIDCETGDPIGASKAGRVIAAEWGGGYGKMVIIDHGNGVTTLYAHNSVLYVSQGDSVRQRERISACGETGHAYGDHLHFEVRVNGQHQNPRNFLP